MAIAETNILLLKSERMTDAADGGGLPTANTVVDGTSNNIFPDISELDRTVGRVNLRLMHVAVQTTTQPPETYFGAHVIVADPPDDPQVSAVLFSTGVASDERAAAVSRMESYLAQGPRYLGYLYGDHIAGQKTLLVLANTTAQPPAEGAVWCLVIDPGLTTEAREYVRITGVAAQTVVLADINGNDVTKLQLTLTLQDSLTRDVKGYEARKQDYLATDRSQVCTTVVADAASYYGIRPLAQAASIGDYTARADSIFAALVPAARSETPITDATPNGAIAVPTAAGGTVSLTTSVALSPSASIYVGGGIQPATLTVTVTGAVVLTDRAGTLRDANDDAVGTVDYENGILSINPSGPSFGNSKTVAYKPSARPTRNATTLFLPITVEGRSQTIVTFLAPIPAPGTLQVSYRAQNNWIVLTDDGSGRVSGGDSSYGAGQINYTTGSLALTLGALPDVGSAVVIVYGARTIDVQRAGGAVAAGMRLALGRAVAPGSLSISWPTGKTATDNGAGALTGDASGTVDYATGEVWFVPTVTPAAGATITVAQSATSATGTSTTLTSSGTDLNGRKIFETGAAITAGSLRFTATYTYPGAGQILSAGIWGKPYPTSYDVQIADNGAGLLVVAGTATQIGTVNYATGQLRIDGGQTRDVPLDGFVYVTLTDRPNYNGLPSSIGA
jgi:hypothetical protein